MSNAHKLFVHVGPAKTGTTALQKFLHQRVPDGLFYPSVGSWTDRSHHILALALGEGDNILGVDLKPEETLRTFKAEVRGAGRDTLVSSEAITDLIFRQDSYLRRLFDFMQDCSDDVEFIYTLRHPLDRAASLYKFLACSFLFAMTLSPREFIEDRVDFLMPGQLLRLLEDHKISYRTIPYAPVSDYVARFMTLIGHPVEGIDFKQENVSSSDEALPLMICVNRLFDDYKTKRGIKFDFDRASKNLTMPQATWPFDPDTVDWFSERVEKDRAALAERGIQYPELTTKPQYVIGRDASERLTAFIKDQIDQHRKHLRPDLNPEQVIAEVFDLFS